ncbi:ankyrin [Lactarius akahatsu]|uniref:Ankyrin n=1 Tax=Lactarius akahatsu TaxID=416441 RepID=A0AAD4LJG2_9AGAM|nr:ankyrin [Lactarius akahatsu]
MPASTFVDTNIWVAAGDGNLGRVRELIEHQCKLSTSPNVPDSFTYTPMHAAASYGHLDVLAYLISRGGDVNVTDEDGETPLYTVENIETAQYLVDHGADPALRNNEGLTVSSRFLREDFPRVAAYLDSLTTSLATDTPDEKCLMVQPSQHSQEAASEHLTSSLMNQLRDIAQKGEEVGEGSHGEEELRRVVRDAVLEGMVTGYSMVNGDDDTDIRSESLRNGDADSAKRRRLDKPDGQL